jgi:DNA gyrase/topoisomerase IV subunit A
MATFGIIGQIDLSHTKDIIEQIARPTWTEVKWVFEFTVYFFACIAALGMLWRLPKIVELVKAITEGRRQIWDLRETAQSLQSTLDDMKQARSDITSVINEFKDADIAGIVKAMEKQVADIQRVTTDDSVLASLSKEDPSARENWEEIKDIWSDARDKLQKVIDDQDGRKTRKYGRMSRLDYTTIINTLLSDGLIDKPIARDATYMNDTYLSFKNQRNPITDEVKREFNQRKRSFDKTITNFKPASPPSAPITVPVPSPSSSPNPGGNGRTPPPDISLT